jgi:Flp pilus assembly CpaE family ATPase
VTVLAVANKVAERADLRHVEDILGEPVHAFIPADEAVVATERSGVALIDVAPACPAVRAIEGLVEGLEPTARGGRVGG